MYEVYYKGLCTKYLRKLIMEVCMIRQKDVYETLKEYFLTSKFLSSTCLDWELKYNDVGEYCNLP